MVAALRMPLRLTDVASEAEAGAERRMFPRKECSACVEGHRLDHTILARQQPRLTLALRDLSLGGLSAITQMPLAKGERVAVFFPPQGIQRGWDAYGTVIRCTPGAMGYRVALQFDPLPAAA